MKKIITNVTDFNPNLDIKELERKGFLYGNEVNEKYFNVYTKYRCGLENYLIKLFNIKKYDDMLFESEYYFVPLKNEQKDFYQKSSSGNLKYIYLRNNIYIERLSTGDLNRIVYLDLNRHYDKLVLEKIIEKTYMLVISEYINGNNLCSLSSVNDLSMMVKNKEFVFGVRYNEFEKNNLNNDDWMNCFINQHKYLDVVLKKATNDIYNKTQMHINFIVYNDYNL